MRNNLLLTISFLSSSFIWGQTTTTLFHDSFESYQDWTYSEIGNWTLIDSDEEEQMGILGVSFPDNLMHPFAAKIINSTTAVSNVADINIPGIRNYEARTGNKALGMFAALLPSNNDWIISPKINLGQSGNKLSFYVKSAYMDNNKYEKFRVLISTTDTNPESFTAFPQVYNDNYFSNSEWTEFVIDLDNYSNMEVYLAINYISEIYNIDEIVFPEHLQKRANVLLLDDFTVTTQSSLGTIDHQKNKRINLYPNPFKNELHIQSDEYIQKIKVFDMTGKLVFEEDTNFTKEAINLSFLKPGIYITEIQYNQETERIKIIKK
ncbi:choice-of-anchor J domain-containing protein [Paenimyroides ceti]